MDIGSLRHSKEKRYYLLAAILGVVLWLALLFATFGTILIIGLFAALFLWISQRVFKAVVFGNAIRVNEQQYSAINNVVERQCQQLGLEHKPEVFIINGEGAVNALAVRFLSGRYVLLFSDLVDLMLMREQTEELNMVIGHELAHHAAGHINWLKQLVILPAKFMPFLASAYYRACEYTADRIAYELVDDKSACARALLTITSGSEALASNTDVQAFAAQDIDIPGFWGFVVEIYASHPRMTRRIKRLQELQP